MRRFWHFLFGHGIIQDWFVMTNGMVVGYCETCDRAVRIT